eukprot:UN00076
MTSFKAMSRPAILHYNTLIRCCSSSQQRLSPYKRTAQRSWRLPESDEDIERYLMKWENVVGHEFFESMRGNCIKYGVDRLSEKQKDGIKKCVGHGSTRLKRALYPKYLHLDPTMRDLLLLSDKDFEFAESKDKEMAHTLKTLRSGLCERGALSFKQLKFAGSLLDQFFGDITGKQT